MDVFRAPFAGKSDYNVNTTLHTTKGLLQIYTSKVYAKKQPLSRRLSGIKKQPFPTISPDNYDAKPKQI